MTTEPTFSRRGLILTAGITGVGALAPALVAPLPASAAPVDEPATVVAHDDQTSGERSTLALAEPITAYHGVSGTTHQQRFNQLSAQGYRMISLSVYGNWFSPLYAAVWVKRAGPAWVAVHGVNSAGYQAKVNEYVAAGYVPVLVSATGPRANPIFAAVFEKLPPGTWIARHGLVDGSASTAGTLASVNKWAKDNNCVPRSLAIYGGVNDRTYAGVWLPNTAGTKWQANQMGNAVQYQAWFDAYQQVPLRPACVDASDPLQYAAIFTDDSVGPWVTRHGMTATQYQAEFDNQLALGRYPISVQGGGIGIWTRYAAVFAARDRPIARAWTQANAVGAGYAGIHAVMRNFMQSRGVRAGVLAVRKNGVLKLSSGYTWAEPGYPTTSPDSLLRIASVSKAFTCAAIQRLVAAGQLSLDQRVFPLLGINSVALPGQTRDSRIDTITVRHCVEHTGGWVRRVSNFDPVFKTREIARALNLPSRAAKRDVARYMYGEPLQYNPGDATTYDSTDRYSNFGYVLLGLVVERVTGQSFHAYLSQAVLNPLGIGGQVLVGATLRSGRRPTEVSYEEPSVGASAWDPWSDVRVATAYGNFLIEAMDSGGGLIATAPAVTAFINHHAVWGLGGRAAGSARSGQMAGTRSFAASRSNGVDWCYTINTAEMYNSTAALNQLTTDLNAAIDASGI